MSLIVPSQRRSPERHTAMFVAQGTGRAGKGTCMANFQARLEADGLSVEGVDQGLKYRAKGKLALRNGRVLDSPTALADFVSSNDVQRAARAILDEASVMDSAAKKAFLYTPEISEASGQVGRLEVSHKIAAKMLRAEVERAVRERERDAVLIDGRAMDTYARQFDKEGLASFVMGWFFKCDSAVAARRSLGIPREKELKDMPVEQQLQLLFEIDRIDRRNYSDATRDDEPSREPVDAQRIDLTTYAGSSVDDLFGRGLIVPRMGMVVVDTSFNSIEEMTGAVTDVSVRAFAAYDALSDEIPGVRVA